MKSQCNPIDNTMVEIYLVQNAQHGFFQQWFEIYKACKLVVSYSDVSSALVAYGQVVQTSQFQYQFESSPDLNVILQEGSQGDPGPEAEEPFNIDNFGGD